MVCYYFSTTHPYPFQCVADGTVSMFLLSMYTDDVPPESAAWFCQWLREAKNEFQVHKSLHSGLHYAAFGLGNSLYGENYNKAVKDLVDGFKKLSATSVYPLGFGGPEYPWRYMYIIYVPLIIVVHNNIYN